MADIKILDQDGNPFDRKALEQPQTAEISFLRTEFANHPSRGLTPEKLSRILVEAERGDLIAQSELFEDMEEKDAHIFAEMGKRKRALLTVDWSIEPPANALADEKSDAAYATEIVSSIPNIDNAMLDLADAIGKAFCNAEMEWHILGGEQIPKSIQRRPQSWFKTNYFDQDKLYLRDASAIGAELWPFGWIRHVSKAKSGYIGRGGLHRVLAWPYLFRNFAIRDLAEFLEIHGLPLRLGKYPSGASDNEKATLLRAVVNMGHNAAGIIPDSMKVEFEEAAKGSSDPHMAMVDWAERSISKAVLGGTLTSQSDGKSSTNALGNVHNEVRHDLMEADARQLGATLSRDLVYPILALNRGLNPDPRRRPKFVFHTKEAADIEQIAAALPALVTSGARIPVNWVNETLQIPVAGPNDEILTPPATASSVKPESLLPDRLKSKYLGAALRQALKTLGGAGSTGGRVDELDGLAAVMGSSWREVMNESVNPILRLAQESESMEAFSAGLDKLAAELGIEAFVNQVADASFVARLYGGAAKDGQ